MEVDLFFSGSKGNATLIVSGGASVMVDCGVTCSALEREFRTAQQFPKLLDGILVTHEHSDHIAGLTAFSNKYNIPIYAHKAAAESLISRSKCNPNLVREYDGVFYIKNLEINYLECSHDVCCCVGYSICDGKRKFSQITDTGVEPKGFREFVQKSDLLILESNHDEQMLRCGKYAVRLKDRILSSLGHLSNKQASEIVAYLPEIEVKKVWLGHLSENNNTAELAFCEALNALKSAGAVEGEDIDLEVVAYNCGRKSNL
ncbi:MAG: MBL fold metallo-hydrolase [Clostridia bacterium]|nr:MBL fold metallo-hydrolase [Clostridia bacterium]